MIIGKYNTLIIRRVTPNGLYLSDDASSESAQVLLPKKYQPEEFQEGDSIKVFVYTDSEDRKVATTETPKLEVGEIASLKVVDITKFGAFMDWGLQKDLFVPFCNQLTRMQKGVSYPVSAYADEVSGRIVGTSKISHMISNSTISVAEQEQVTIIIARRLERGYRVIINSKHWGMLYDNQIYTPISLGETYSAWVTKITDDNRIDVALQQQGYSGTLVAVDALKKLFDENNGFISIGDKSPSEIIQAQTGLSKKTFKRALGVLFKEGFVEPSDYSSKQIKPFI